jgi:hypothetical protein
MGPTTPHCLGFLMARFDMARFDMAHRGASFRAGAPTREGGLSRLRNDPVFFEEQKQAGTQASRLSASSTHRAPDKR